MKGLYYYKLQSPYSEDVTKNCKLTINEIDSNFLSLKDEDIKSAEFIYDEENANNKSLILTKNNGEKLIVPLTDITYNLNVDTVCGESGTTLSISYDGKGGKKEFTITDIVTADKLMKLVGENVMTRVITDGTLKGDGRMENPLGLNGVEKSGSYAPVKAKIDLTSGGKLPDVAKLGTRYVTVENVNDYGYLYNGDGLDKIIENLAAEKKGWRVPSKEDWDKLLNAIEPCAEYRNHNSASCHVELGKISGKYLKSECGWLGQSECECTPTAPTIGCVYSTNVCEKEDTDYVVDDLSEYPMEKVETPYGVDKYGMTILPSGMMGHDVYDRPMPDGFKADAYYWTTTHVHGEEDQDRYVKVFSFKKGGVSQEAQCPTPFYSVRLVKDYDGCNYLDTEYIDGIPYKTILFAESGQIWLASNYAKVEGFKMAESTVNGAEVAKVNNGEGIKGNRKALFLNEWNGRYWEKKQMNEGDTVVVENPCFEGASEKEFTYCWKTDFDNGETENERECETITIETEPQHNVEYRVFSDNGCDQDLYNTDDLVTERVINVLIPILVKEKEERIKADIEINKRIDQEIADRETSEGEINDRLQEEIERATAAENALDEKISKEIEDRTEADSEINKRIDEVEATVAEDKKELLEKINEEVSRAQNAESEIRTNLEREIERATTAEELLEEEINAEVERAKEAEKTLDGKIEAETERATEREDEIESTLLEKIDEIKAEEGVIEGKLINPNPSEPYTIKVGTNDPYSLVLESNDKKEENAIKIAFDGNFGEI